jgi:hypothetical protein
VVVPRDLVLARDHRPQGGVVSVPGGWTAVEDAIHDWVVTGSGIPGARVIWAQQSGPRPSTPWISMRLLTIATHGIDYVDHDTQVLALDDDDVESVDAGDDELTLTAHEYETGDGPVRLTTTGTLPAGLSLATDYWIEVVDANTIRLATSFPDAMNGAPVDVTDGGSGTHTISTTDDSLRQGEEAIATVRGARIATLSLQCFGGNATVLDTVAAAAALPDVADALHAASIGVIELGPAQSIDGLVGAALFEPRAVAAHRLYLPLALAAAAGSGIIDYVTVSGPEQDVSVPEDPT